MGSSWDAFPGIWVVDFEFTCPPGHRPTPICLVAEEVRTHQIVHHWFADGDHPACPWRDHDVIVPYFATAEVGCCLALNWPVPRAIVDLYVEFRWLTNTGDRRDRSVLGACAFFGLPTIEAADKLLFRELAMRGGPYTSDEQQQLLAYCAGDVHAEVALFERMRPLIDLPRALLRGRSMAAFARIEQVGVPIDGPRLRLLQHHWDDLKGALISTVDQNYGVYDDLTFKADRFDHYLAAHDIPWPRLASGALDLQDRTFRDRARAFPQLQPLRELRASLADLRLGDLAIGPDDRNRVLLSPFGSKTSRNTPSTARFVFGPSTWIRSLIRPEPETGLAYIDWSHQELGIAAALSGDRALQQAYSTGDPYLAFAIQAGAAPPTATKESHGAIRDLFKTCVLGLNYGMGVDSLAARINKPPCYADQLVRYHQRTYPQFWKWAEAAQSFAFAANQIVSRLGWRLLVTPETRVRTLRNFPAQANGAELLRLAAIFITEAGIRLCAPIHDAVLIEAPLAALRETVEQVQALMAEASRIVLDGFTLRTEASLIQYPARYDDPRGRVMWRTLCALLPALAPSMEEDRCALT